MADEPRLTPVPRWTIGGAAAASQRARRSEFVKFTAGDGRGIRPKWAPECGGPGRGPVGIQNQHPPATAAPRARSHAHSPPPRLSAPTAFPELSSPPHTREAHNMCSAHSTRKVQFPYMILPELYNKFSLFDINMYTVCVFSVDSLPTTGKVYSSTDLTRLIYVMNMFEQEQATRITALATRFKTR